MPDYRRARHPGGTYFFTVNLLQRRGNALLARRIEQPRDVDADFQARMDYVHFNLVKHGLAKRVANWPFSTFHRLVKQGIYPADWRGGSESLLRYDD